MTYAIVHTATNTQTGPGAMATTITSTTSGNTLVVAHGTIANLTGSTITDNLGSTYTLVDQNAGTTATASTFWILPNCPSGITSVSITSAGGSSPQGVVIREYAGLFTASTVDVHNIISVITGSNPSSPSVTTTNATDVIIGYCAVQVSSGLTAGAGFGDLASVVASSTVTVAMEDKVVTTTGSQMATFTATSANYTCGVVALKIVAAATLPNISILQQSANDLSYSGNTTVTVTALTSGSTLVFAFGNSSNSTANFITSITGGGTWTQANSVGQTAIASSIWYLTNAVAGTTSITFNTAVGGYYSYAEVTGLSATSPLDQTATGVSTGSGGTTTATTGSNVTQKVELVIATSECAFSGKGDGLGGVPSTYLSLSGYSSKGGTPFQTWYKIRMASLGTETVSSIWVSSGAGEASLCLATFVPVSTLIQQRDSRTPNNSIVTGGPSTSTTLALTQAPFSGNMQILSIENGNSGGSPTGAGSVTQTGATWHKGPNTAGTGTACEIWYSANVSGSASTTITFGNAIIANYCEWYGVNAIDQQQTSLNSCSPGGSITETSGTTGTTTVNPELAICAWSGYASAKGGGSWGTPANSYTQLATSSTAKSTASQLLVAYKILNSLTTTSSSATFSNSVSSNQYSTALATFGQQAITSLVETGNLLLMGIG